MPSYFERIAKNVIEETIREMARGLIVKHNTVNPDYTRIVEKVIKEHATKLLETDDEIKNLLRETLISVVRKVE